MNYSSKLLTAFLLLGNLWVGSACNKSPIDPSEEGTDSGTAGYVIGNVTDPQGNPLQKATIYLDHTVFSGNGPEVKTSSDGNYKIQIANFAGEWVAKGYILKAYNDRVYKVALHPETEDSFTSTDKPVRNFQWKLTGHLPDISLDLYYGGTMELFKDPNVEDLNDRENIEFTLTPVGPLIDGSTGKVLKVKAKRNADAVLDIPIGRYKVAAVYTPTGKSLLVCDAWGDDYNYQSSVVLDFLGSNAAHRANHMGIAFTHR